MLPRTTKNWLRHLAPVSSFEGAMMWRRGFAAISLKESVASRTGRSQKWEKVDRLRQLVEAGKIRLRASWMTQPP